MTVTARTIPMLDLKREYLYMKNDIDAAIAACLEHQKWILGPEVGKLENGVSNFLRAQHCVGASSGTDALVLSLRALAIKTKGKEYFDRDDNIITTPFTFTATGDAILRSGATPVFVDIDPQTFNISPKNIQSYLTTGKAAGILPVHLYGQSCDMDQIMHIASDHGLFVVEDVAQAFGAEWKGKKLGSIGACGAFSFFPSKNLGGFGDGGMVSTSDDRLAEIIRMLVKHGGKDKYNVDHIGYNARLDTLHAAVLLAKFNYSDEFNEKRRNIAARYSKELAGSKDFALPHTIDGALHVYHQFTIRVKNNKRDALQRSLKEAGISTMIYYPVPLHSMKVFEGRSGKFGSLVESEKASAEVLSLPIEPLQSEAETEYVIDYLKKQRY